MGIVCLPEGATCSVQYEQIYSQIKMSVKDYMVSKEAPPTGVINFGKLVGDSAPLCPDW